MRYVSCVSQARAWQHVHLPDRAGGLQGEKEEGDGQASSQHSSKDSAQGKNNHTPSSKRLVNCFFRYH